eukprot:GHVN01045347.1.p1 GENE.GHVN01045347.1~~GHVN01045347.1.p1  ORF type:complete len:372 (+),score=50.21 GHVN01045347.1:167-1282(+)
MSTHSVLLAANPTETPLTEELMKKLKCCYAIKEGCGRVNGLDWSDDGELIGVSTDDEFINIKSIHGRTAKHLQSRIHGCQQFKYLKGAKRECLIVCPIRKPLKDEKPGPPTCLKAAVRKWEIEPNKFSHAFMMPDEVLRPSGLQLSHAHDKDPHICVACCKNGSVRLFSDNSDKREDLPELGIADGVTPSASFSSHRLALHLTQNTLTLYDLYEMRRSEGPYTTKTIDIQPFIPQLPDIKITSLTFSPDSHSLLCGTNYPFMFAVDDEQGALVGTFEFDSPESDAMLNLTQTQGGVKPFSHDMYPVPTFTPDNQFVICGDPRHRLHVWKTDGEWVASYHTSSEFLQLVRFNPSKALLAGAGYAFTLWAPEV